MLRLLCRAAITASLVLCFAITLTQRCSAQIFGIRFDTGQLYTISLANAAVTLVGDTGVVNLGSLAYRESDGFLYGITVGNNPDLYRIDPATAEATLVAAVGADFAFEGALAISPTEVGFGTNLLNSTEAMLFSIDLDTGATTTIGTIGARDINGLSWRPDGKLVGLDRVENVFLEIDPLTAASTVIAEVSPNRSNLGGMTVFNGIPYFSTSNPDGALYSFNQITGTHQFIGNFAPSFTGSGISGLASPAVPDFTLGDINQDGFVNFLDIGPIIFLLSTGGFEDAADIDRNGLLNFLDLGPFIALLSQQ